MKKIMILLVPIFLASASILSANPQPEGRVLKYGAPDWFTDRQNLAHTASNNEAVKLPLVLRWQAKLGGAIRSSVIGAYGYLFVGADDGVMYALAPTDGHIVWKYQAGTPISAAATAVAENKGADKYLWFTADDGSIHALDGSSGALRWKSTGGVGTFNSPTNYASGIVYHVYHAGPVTSKLRAINGGTGVTSWETASFNITTVTPTLGAGWLVQAISQGGRVAQAFQPISGNSIWEVVSTGAQAGGWVSAIVNSNVGQNNPELAYLCPRDRVVRAVVAVSGQMRWETELPGVGPVTGAALTQERNPNVLVVSQDTELYAVNPMTGQILWRQSHATNLQDPTTRRTPAPAIYGGLVFHIEGGTGLVARKLATGEKAWSTTLDAATVSSPTVGGQTVYIATSSGAVCAFSPK